MFSRVRVGLGGGGGGGLGSGVERWIVYCGGPGWHRVINSELGSDRRRVELNALIGTIPPDCRGIVQRRRA